MNFCASNSSLFLYCKLEMSFHRRKIRDIEISFPCFEPALSFMFEVDLHLECCILFLFVTNAIQVANAIRMFGTMYLLNYIIFVKFLWLNYKTSTDV